MCFSRSGRCKYFSSLLFVVALVEGCQKSVPGIHVRGHVSYRDQAVANGSLMFYPVQGRATVAVTSESGDYEAVLIPGDHDVVINISVKPPAGWKEGDPIPPPKFVLPDQYTKRAKSTLKASVKEDQSEPIDFNLK
jgi:hypothetical protein